MASKTVIDQLIVKLGLDPTDFTKGQKQAAAGLVEFERDAKSSASNVGSSLVSMGAKFLTLGAIIYGLKKAWNFVSDAATVTRQLGIDSRNFGLAANEMRNFQNAIEMMGGKAEDATRTIAGFQQSIFNLAYNGQVSESLVMLARLGVQFQDSAGRARNFKDILLDTAGALETAQKNGTMTREAAYQYALSAGFDPGTANLALQGRTGAAAELAAQTQRRQVSGADVAAATGAVRARIGREQELQAAGVASVGVAGGFVEGVNKFGEYTLKLLDGTESFKEAGKSALDFWKGKLGLANNNPGNLEARGNQPRDAGGRFRQFTKLSEGIQALDKQISLDQKRGLTLGQFIEKYAPKKDHNDTEAYIRNVEKMTGGRRDFPLSMIGRDPLIEAMTRQEGHPQDLATIHAALANHAVPTPGAQGSAASGNTTNVDIGEVNVHTAATDAAGIARDIDAELQRKTLASYGAGQGQN